MSYRVTRTSLANAIILIGVTLLPVQAQQAARPRPPRTYLICNPPAAPDLCEGKIACGIIQDETDISVSPNGEVAVNGQKVTDKTLREYAASWAKYPDLTFPIVVSGPASTPYSKIASVVATLRESGIKNVACEVRQPQVKR